MTDRSPAAPPAPSRRRGPAGIAAGLVLLLGCAGVLYGMRGAGKEGAPECRDAVARGARLDPFVRGEVAALALRREPRRAPDLAFNGPDGRPTTLAAHRGRVVLLNLWATWCVPCRKEMPALDALQAKLGGDGFEVVPVNIDTDRPENAKAFLREHAITHLPLDADPTADAFQVLRASGEALGLPTTLLLDPRGCEIGTMAGPADWASPEAQALIQAAEAS